VESLGRLVCSQLGWRLEPQVEIEDRTGRVRARVDGLIASDDVVVEFDGAMKYRVDRSVAEDDNPLYAEKRREDLLRELGFEVVRLTWADLLHPERVDAKIRAAVARARARSPRRAAVG
jgi:very-short-patch-repair endonuclease